MTRDVSDVNILSKFCLDFCKVVEKYSEYIVVSGFVAIASGRIRGTEDIDMIIKPLDEDTFNDMHTELIHDGFVSMQSDNPKELYEYLKENISLRYTFKDSPVPEMEVKFSKDELDEYQLKTKTKLPLTNLDIWYSSINMNIAFKEELLKSPKDLEDARHLRIIYKELVNDAEIIKIKKMIQRYRL